MSNAERNGSFVRTDEMKKKMTKPPDQGNYDIPTCGDNYLSVAIIQAHWGSGRREMWDDRVVAASLGRWRLEII